MLIGAAALFGGLGGWAALTALGHLASAGPAYLNVTSDYDEGAHTIAAIHTDLVQYAAVSLAGLVLLAPLAFAVRRARPAARIAAWTIGITVTTALLITLAGGPDELVSPGGTENPATRAALDNLLPTWYLDATSLLTVAQLAAVIAFCVLLLRTGAADFYRSPRPQGPDGLWRRATTSELSD